MRGKTSTLAVLALVAAALPLGGTFPAASQEQCPQPLPDPRVIPWQITGPPAERLNLIILGDGYQCDQQSLFRGDVARNLAVMWATEPYKSYRNYMNVYAVEISSVHYGVRCDPDGRVRHPDGTIRDTGEREGPIDTKNTALRMIYQNGCSDPLARGTVYGGAPVNCQDYAAYYANPADACETGNQAHNRIIDQFVVPVIGIPRTSQSVQTLAIFNTFTYGGIGGTQATTSGGSPQGPLISLHELGHSHGTMADEYPYSSRDVVRPCYTGGEPGSFHHTIRTSTQDMIDTQFKWWRWIGEESLSGGEVGLHEGGGMYPCGQRRPSEHSIMRWIGFDWDQVGREHMLARITGLRNSGQMPLPSRPTSGMAGSDEVLWVNPLQPRNHALQVTWRIGGAGGQVVPTNNAGFLDLGALSVMPGTVIHAEVRDPVGPTGLDWVRNPSTGSSSTDSGFNGPRYVQTRQWTVGMVPVMTSPIQSQMITGGTLTDAPVGGEEWVYVETYQPADRVLDVTWRFDGVEIPNPHNLRNLDVGSLDVAPGTYSLTATVTDPADPDLSDTREWVVDNALPDAPRTLTEPLTTLAGPLEHPVYFGGWDMWLEPQDERTGYQEDLYVVGQLRLDEDGWFNYFGFPEEPMPDSPYRFRHSGLNVKALTYGNLGTGGLSKATFEQYFDGHPSGTFEPGYGTHLVEHRAIDPAGNVGEAGAYRATVLPGGSPECTQTVDGPVSDGLVVESGVTCLAGDARINGGVTVLAGASLIGFDGARINDGLTADEARVVQLFGTRVKGDTAISGATEDVILAGSLFTGSVTLIDNQSPTITILSGATRRYGVLVIGNRVTGDLSCVGNVPLVNDFDVPNHVGGTAYEQCGSVVSSEVLESTPPVTTATFTPELRDGWTRNPTVELSADDGPDGSGVDYTEYRLDGGEWTDYQGTFQVTGEGSHTLRYRSVDLAANQEEEQTVEFSVDASPPSITIVSPQEGATYGAGQEVASEYACDDALSGVASCEGTVPSGSPIDTSGVGTHTFEVEAFDRAGNHTTRLVSYQVVFAFEGFFKPVSNPPKVNVAKAGRTIPVKFRLGGFQGLDIFAPGSPASQAIACESGAPQEEVEETITSGTSGLSYDPQADQYNYSWKTEREWAGTCRQLVVDLADGTRHIALFRLK